MRFVRRVLRRVGLAGTLVMVVFGVSAAAALAATHWGSTYTWTVHSTGMYTKTAIVTGAAGYGGLARMGTITGFFPGANHAQVQGYVVNSNDTVLATGGLVQGGSSQQYIDSSTGYLSSSGARWGKGRARGLKADGTWGNWHYTYSTRLDY